MMTLRRLLKAYIAARNEERPINRPLAPSTPRHYRETIRAYEKHLGYSPTLADLDPKRINGFLVALSKTMLSTYTIKNRRTGLRAFLRFAVREGLVDFNPDKLRRVYTEPLEPKGYDAAAMQKLLATAAGMKFVQRRTRIKQSTYWMSLLLLLWNTGIRLGDVVRIRVDKFVDGRLWIHEKKTGKSRWHVLQPTTREAIEACIAENPNREFIWPGYDIRHLSRAFSALAKRAGVGGTSRYVRRGAASELERLQPNMGWRFLNHSTPTVFEKHYACQMIIGDSQLAPPELTMAQA
jgi:integrase